MNHLRLLFAAAMLGGMAQLPVRAQAPLPPFDLALTLNDGVSESVYRGWPLVFRGDAVLMREVAVPIALDLPSLTLAITPAQGPAMSWPLRRVPEFASAPMLGVGSESVRVVWLLTAEQTVALVPGDYTARLSWAGRTSPPVTFSVLAPPATVPAEDEIRRALLESQTALYLGDTAGALAALVPAESSHPESIDLLVQRARVQVQRGEYREALRATQRARTIFDRDYPNAEHPPVSILEVESKARAEISKGIKPGPPLPGQPGRGPRRTVSSPPNIGPAIIASAVPATPAVGVTPSAAVPAPSAPPVAPIAPMAASVGTVVPFTELTEAKILADPAGQWAASASSGSQYGRTQYSAAKATGAPDVPVVGNSPDAWCPASKDKGTDWLEVTFAKPVQAVEVRVRQNDAAGALAKIEAIEPDGTAHVWWEGVDPFKATAVREIVWFAIRVPKTAYLVAKIKITLNLAAATGWKEIDAVQLVGKAP